MDLVDEDFGASSAQYHRLPAHCLLLEDTRPVPRVTYYDTQVHTDERNGVSEVDTTSMVIGHTIGKGR